MIRGAPLRYLRVCLAFAAPPSYPSKTMSVAVPTPFAWDASYCIKNATLNDQHKQLFVMINDLDKNRGSADVLKVLPLPAF